jgi:hypothetical protein
MEKSDRIREILNHFKVIGMISILTYGLKVEAGVVLIPPTAPLSFNDATTEESDGFPESRFGHPPKQPDENEVAPRHLRPFPHLSQSHGRTLASVENEVSSESLNKNPSANLPAPLTHTRGLIQEVSLIADDTGFFPKTLFVTRDIPVRLYVTGASKKSLCFMVDDFQVRKQIRLQKIEEISFTPTSAGQYRYYCPINGAEGTIVVKDGDRSQSLKTEK